MNIYIADTLNYRIRKVNFSPPWGSGGGTTPGATSTVAGTGSTVSSGDGGKATSAGLNLPYGVAVDMIRGYLYVSEYGAHKVRRIDMSTGIITTVAGRSGGSGGYGGDGGPATSARLNNPWSLEVDRLGNLFIADSSNAAVRLVQRVSGLISTVAGTGVAGTAGDGGPATAAQLSQPTGLSLDEVGRDLYVADAGSSTVRKVPVSSLYPDSIVFRYTHTVQTYTVPSVAAQYKVVLSVYGPQGGYGYGGCGFPGLGGLAAASFVLNRGQVLNVYVGGAGSDGTSGQAGGWNGGGHGGFFDNNRNAGGGGGASDVRLDDCCGCDEWD